MKTLKSLSIVGTVMAAVFVLGSDRECGTSFHQHQRHGTSGWAVHLDLRCGFVGGPECLFWPCPGQQSGFQP